MCVVMKLMMTDVWSGERRETIALAGRVILVKQCRNIWHNPYDVQTPDTTQSDKQYNLFIKTDKYEVQPGLMQ